MYVFDTNVFIALSQFYPTQFPTIWERIGALASTGKLRSVREVFREIDGKSPSVHLTDWCHGHREIFLAPTLEEQRIVKKIFIKEQYRGLVKRTNILKGTPVADPFVIASAKVLQELGCVVTLESIKPNAARIPTVCKDLGVKCINLEDFFKLENLQY